MSRTYRNEFAKKSEKKPRLDHKKKRKKVKYALKQGDDVIPYIEGR